METQKQNGSPARGFEGPFMLLITPHWPAEMERRGDYAGPHFQLSSIFPIKTGGLTLGQPAVDFPAKETPTPSAPQALPFVPARETEAPAPWIFDRPGADVIVRQGPWKARVERQSKGIGDGKLARLMTALDRPRTARQIARKIGVSRPTVDTWLRALQRAIGAHLKIVVKRRGARGPKSKFFWVDTLAASHA